MSGSFWWILRCLTVGVCWQNSAFAITKSDAISVSLTNTSQNDWVSVNKEFTFFAIRKLDGFFTAPVKLKHRPIHALVSSRDCSRAKQITSAHIAARYRVMGNGLRHWIVQVLHVWSCQLVRFTHLRCLDQNVQRDVVGAQIFVFKVGQHGRVLLRQGYLERSQGFGSDYPGRDCWGEVFSVEGTERHIFPLLNISCTPIVEKTVAKYMITSVVNFNWLTQFITNTNNRAHL